MVTVFTDMVGNASRKVQLGIKIASRPDHSAMVGNWHGQFLGAIGWVDAEATC